MNILLDDSGERVAICRHQAAYAVMSYLVGLPNERMDTHTDGGCRGGWERCKAYQAILVRLAGVAYETGYGSVPFDEDMITIGDVDEAVNILRYAGRESDDRALMDEEVFRHFSTVCDWLAAWDTEIVELGDRLHKARYLSARSVSGFLASRGRAKGIPRGLACLCFPLPVTDAG